MEIPYGPLGFLATRGPNLFSNQYTESAVLGMVTGHIGIKLERIGPWPSLEFPYGQFGFLAIRELI